MPKHKVKKVKAPYVSNELASVHRLTKHEVEIEIARMLGYTAALDEFKKHKQERFDAAQAEMLNAMCGLGESNARLTIAIADALKLCKTYK
jgi:hypothetical protein